MLLDRGVSILLAYEKSLRHLELRPMSTWINILLLIILKWQGLNNFVYLDSMKEKISCHFPIWRHTGWTSFYHLVQIQELNPKFVSCWQKSALISTLSTLTIREWQKSHGHGSCSTVKMHIMAALRLEKFQDAYEMNNPFLRNRSHCRRVLR